MKLITKESVFEKIEEKSSHRKCFKTNSGIQENKDKPTFSFPFESIKDIFEIETGLKVIYNQRYRSYYLMINDENMLEIIRNWEKKRGEIIFLKDTLPLSIALAMNFQDNNTHKYTEIGELENEAKNHQNKKSIKKLIDIVSSIIQDLPFYKDADYICAVPCNSEKEFDLPQIIAMGVSQRTNKVNITSRFKFNKKKQTIKKSKLECKWDVWVKAGIFFRNCHKYDVKGKTVIIIDDKYQSGVTIQYIASILQQAGAARIYGLCLVKTLRNTDNILNGLTHL